MKNINLSEQEEEVLKVIKKQNNPTIASIVKTTGIGEETVVPVVRFLLKKGLIETTYTKTKTKKDKK